MWAEVRDFYNIEYTERGEMFELMHGSKLYAFTADLYRFPKGLKRCIDGEEFAVYEHFSRDVKILKKNESFDLELKSKDDFKLYIIVPIKDGFAPTERVDKFISPASIKGVINGKIELVENGKLVIDRNWVYCFDFMSFLCYY